MKGACILALVSLVAALGCERNGGVPVAMDCIANLKRLEGAKQTWAVENHKTTNDAPDMSDLTSFLKEHLACRAGGVYTVGRVGEKPKCSIKGHELP
jgi:hypothetical protein